MPDCDPIMLADGSMVFPCDEPDEGLELPTSTDFEAFDYDAAQDVTPADIAQALQEMNLSLQEVQLLANPNTLAGLEFDLIEVGGASPHYQILIYTQDNTILPLNEYLARVRQGISPEQQDIDTTRWVNPASIQAGQLLLADVRANIELVPESVEDVSFVDVRIAASEFADVYEALLNASDDQGNRPVGLYNLNILAELFLAAKKKKGKDDKEKKKELKKKKRDFERLRRNCNLRKLLKEAIKRWEEYTRGALSEARRSELQGKIKGGSITPNDLPVSSRRFFDVDFWDMSLDAFDKKCDEELPKLRDAIEALERGMK